MPGTFVPEDFTPPEPPSTPEFRLEPLGPQHNEADYAAWTSSMEHIHATPGMHEFGGWPEPMTLEQNRGDLERHERDFRERKGFTYTVLDPQGTVIGCLYIYPKKDAPGVTRVHSWVAASRAELDVELYRVVRDWLDTSWPLEHVDYAVRPGA